MADELYAEKGDTLLVVANEVVLYLSQIVANEKSDVNVYKLYCRLHSVCADVKAKQDRQEQLLSHVQSQAARAATRPKTEEEKEFEAFWCGFGNPQLETENERLRAAIRWLMSLNSKEQYVNIQSLHEFAQRPVAEAITVLEVLNQP